MCEFGYYATSHLERFISKVTCYVSRATLNPARLLTHCHVCASLLVLKHFLSLTAEKFCYIIIISQL